MKTRRMARVRNQTDHRLGYRDDTNAIVGLLEPPGPTEWDLFTCLNSLRDVEGKVDLVLTGEQRILADLLEVLIE